MNNSNNNNNNNTNNNNNNDNDYNRNNNTIRILIIMLIIMIMIIIKISRKARQLVQSDQAAATWIKKWTNLSEVVRKQTASSHQLFCRFSLVGTW